MRREQAAALGWVAALAAIVTSPITAPTLAFFVGRWTA